MSTRRIHIRMLGRVTSTLGSFPKGKVVEMLPEDAQPLIDSGAAEKLTAEEVAALGENAETTEAEKE